VLSGKSLWGTLEKWQRRRVSYCFFYFAFMEGLQFFQYLVIDDCSSLANIILTALGWVHICWQPLFSNFAFSALDAKNNKEERKDTWNFVLKFAFVAGFLMALRIVIPVFTEATEDSFMFKPCNEQIEGVCGEKTCTENGVYHLKWTFKMLKPAYVFPSISVHFLLMFVAPFLLGLRLESIVLFLTGPAIAVLFTKATDGEKASIWCFFSIAESFITIITTYCACKRQLKALEKAKKE
jgi:hypothetical protein